MELLLKYNTVSNSYITPIHNAIKQGNKLEVVKLLLEYNTSPSLKAKGICLAAFSNELAILKFLLEQGVNPSGQCSDDGATPISLAKQQGNSEIAKFLLEYSVNP